ncbi:MAG TPA: thiamine pyrophosphate-dependent enzyme [Gammaproteobacteria bacterium]|jgi:pyruvate/2-oxoacid:ferredoxin oxidoreductase beta subunit/Pyruvate/2-oxoacid:ferredoxin oxidoreductase gamma subunit
MNAAVETFLSDEIGPLPFCPGCGHDRLVKALDKALVSLQPEPNKVVIVTDIGCIGLADRYFVTHAFHGLHGRSITYACGLKLARPELTVIVLKGDGGCGIGGAHLLNVARRNIGITLIVANNFNYGMTGGQHSVTTPLEGLTATTPQGNIEGALDLCGVTIAAGAPWVYRGTGFDGELPDRIADAIRQPGFAMLDVWDMCTAYYLPRNRFGKKDLAATMERLGLQSGLLADRPRPEFGELYRQIHADAPPAPTAKPRIEAKYKHALARQTGIVIAGSAGQKVRSAAGLLARAGMFAGLEATQKDDYPITVMTGHSLSEIILSPERIDYTAIESPDYLLLISRDGLDKARGLLQRLDRSATVYAEETLELPVTAAKVVRLPFAATAKKIDRLSIGTLALAAMLHDGGLLPLQALEESISAVLKPALAEVNRRALAAGAALAGEAREA